VLLYGDTCVALEHAATLVIAARSAKLLCWSACVWLHCAARANVGTTAWPQLGPCGIDLSLSLSLLSLSLHAVYVRVFAVHVVVRECARADAHMFLSLERRGRASKWERACERTWCTGKFGVGET